MNEISNERASDKFAGLGSMSRHVVCVCALKIKTAADTHAKSATEPTVLCCGLRSPPILILYIIIKQTNKQNKNRTATTT